MKTKVIMFEFEKTTKNTAKFNEVPAVGEPTIVGALYVQKWFVPSMGTGTKARILLEVQEGGADHFINGQPKA